jgi:hypothetical protein
MAEKSGDESRAENAKSEGRNLNPEAADPLPEYSEYGERVSVYI